MNSFVVLVLVCFLTPDWRHSFNPRKMGGVLRRDTGRINDVLAISFRRSAPMMVRVLLPDYEQPKM